MIIDERLIADGIEPYVLSKLIDKHKSDFERLTMLKNYYLGKHEILERKKKSEGVANNKIVCNYAKYIVDMVQSYLVGNAVTYEPAEGVDIEELKRQYLEQDIASLDSENLKNMSIYGRTYELIYSNEDSKPRSVALNPCNTFVCYSQNATQDPLFAVYYYPLYDLEGNVEKTICDVYDRDYIYRYEASGDTTDGLELIDGNYYEEHHFNSVPIIEYKNNTDEQGDFEQLISLIDAYNALQSDRVNDKEQFVDAFLFLIGVDLDSGLAKQLKEEKILLGIDGAKAEYLSKVLSESDIEVLKNSIKNDIHKFSLVPDLTDENFGNNLSGVAIKYKLLGFEQFTKNKERYYAKTLKQRFAIYNQFLVTKNAMKPVAVHEIDVMFKHNLPANDLETAQIISLLEDIASDETLLRELAFVNDAKEEVKFAKVERIERMKEEQQSLIGDYDEDTE